MLQDGSGPPDQGWVCPPQSAWGPCMSGVSISTNAPFPGEVVRTDWTGRPGFVALATPALAPTSFAPYPLSWRPCSSTVIRQEGAAGRVSQAD
jgi:hypothetical protein